MCSSIPRQLSLVVVQIAFSARNSRSISPSISKLHKMIRTAAIAFVISAIWDVVLRFIVQYQIGAKFHFGWMVRLREYFKKKTILEAALLAGFPAAITSLMTSFIGLYHPLSPFTTTLVILVISAVLGAPMRYKSGLYPVLAETYYNGPVLETIASDMFSGAVVASTFAVLSRLRLLDPGVQVKDGLAGVFMLVAGTMALFLPRLLQPPEKRNIYPGIAVVLMFVVSGVFKLLTTYEDGRLQRHLRFFGFQQQTAALVSTGAVRLAGVFELVASILVIHGLATNRCDHVRVGTTGLGVFTIIVTLLFYGKLSKYKPMLSNLSVVAALSLLRCAAS